MIQILARRSKNNPILLGEPGVGKTAIAEGLALRIVAGNVPEFLREKRVLSLDVGLLMAGAKERGELESRVTGLIKEIQDKKDVVLMIDEVHTLIGAGAVGKGGGGGMDISNMLKPPWRVASSSASAPPRWTSTASTSRRTPRSSVVSSP